ncbi:MAG: methylaspartate mutase [Marinobacter nauticus]
MKGQFRFDLNDAVQYIKSLDKESVHSVLTRCESEGRVAVQPRSGVGGHQEMRNLLTTIEESAAPDISTLTIDSYTRLQKFDQASNLLASAPEQLNGYPLVSQGIMRGRNLNESTRAPLDIRHGSPIANRLFEAAISSGITSFEGGGITYNLPYCKDVPLEASLESWRRIDELCGDLAQEGVIVSRESFGTLTAVLVPPSLALSLSFLEAMCGIKEGVKCVQIAYPQGGCLAQDIAALRAIRELSEHYVPADVDIFPVLHQYMGPFPSGIHESMALVAHGAIVAKAGLARKVVVKTVQESQGIPTAKSNADAINFVRAMTSSPSGIVEVLSDAVSLEQKQIVQESRELIDSAFDQNDPYQAIIDAFHHGVLDVPFSPSRAARGLVLPSRARNGAIRYFDTGNLRFSQNTKDFNRDSLAMDGLDYQALLSSINFFAEPT